jgi:hypothetical protein
MHATAQPRDDARHASGVGASDDPGWVLGVLHHSEPGRVCIEYGSGRSVAYRCRRTSRLRRLSNRSVPRNGGVVVVVHEGLRVLALLVDVDDLPLRLFAVADEVLVPDPIERDGSVELFSVARVDAA